MLILATFCPWDTVSRLNACRLRLDSTNSILRFDRPTQQAQQISQLLKICLRRAFKVVKGSRDHSAPSGHLFRYGCFAYNMNFTLSEFGNGSFMNANAFPKSDVRCYI